MTGIPERQRSDDVDGNSILLGALLGAEVNWGKLHCIYSELPPRERQVLDLLVGGLEFKQIAASLGSRPATIRVQLAKLRQKFGVQTNQQLVILVVRMFYEISSDQ
jgi:two-component system response regulator FixJ